MFKKFEKIIGILIAFGFLYRIISVVAALTAEVYGGEAADGHVGAFIHRDKAGHLLRRCVGLEGDLAADPVGAFAGDGFQGQFIA